MTSGSSKAVSWYAEQANFGHFNSSDEVSEWVSSFLTAHQHIFGYLVPYHGMVDSDKKGGCIKAI